MCVIMKYMLLSFFFSIFFFSNLFAEVGGQELKPPAFLPELLDTPERILSKNGLSFISIILHGSGESAVLQGMCF